MRNKIFLFIVTMLYIAGAKVYAHDIQVVNDDGVTIYYDWSNNGNELAVSYKGTLLFTDILYNFYSGNVAIPTSVTYNGKTYNVTSIKYCAFMNCSSLTSVTIPNSVTSIGNGAFSGCSGLTSITIPNSVTSIDQNAFEGCSSLTSITIPPGIKIIDFNTFKGCSSLVSFNIPDNVTKIEGFAFEGCSSLTAISIPNSVTTLGPKAFEDCTSLSSITISNNVTRIEYGTFAGCSNLSSITIPNSVSIIEGGCWGGSSDGTEFYNRGAFEDCYRLTLISLPQGVTSIGDEAFKNCNISNIKVPITNFTAFCENKVIECIYHSIGKPIQLIDNEEKEIKEYVVPESVASIGNRAFINCDGLTAMTIAGSVTSIGDYAFYGCSNLKNVYCYAEKLPLTGSNSFNKSLISSATLHVPGKSLALYKATLPWCEFGKIISIDNIYTLTYIVDGDVYKTYEVEYNLPITPEAAPTKEGYTFSGWSDIPETMPANDVTVTGKFTINKYKLIYKVDDVEYKSYDVEYGATITPEGTPTKEGYSFSGWSEIPEKMPAHDVTVTGTFTINKYKLNYKVDGAEYKSYELEYGTKITPEPAPTKEGYTFSGWSEIPEKMPAHDVTVTGSFTQNPLSQCAMPTIELKDGKLVFCCETPEVEFNYNITANGSKTGKGNNLPLTLSYTVRVYASKEGMADSETAVQAIYLKKGDVNMDGIVSVADAVSVVEIIMDN